MVKRILVTGACGFGGGHMVNVLLEKGFEVEATDLSGAAARKPVPRKADFIPADLTDPKWPKKLFEEHVDYVFNPAALFDYTAPYELMYQVNVEGTKNLLDAVLDAGGVKRFVHWSTADVYGKLDPKLLPYREDSPKRPLTNYQRTKWEGEQMVSKYGEERGLPFTIMRPVPIHGPGNFYGMAMLYFMMARGQANVVPTKMSQLVPSIHVEDLARSALHLARYRGARGEAYNILDDSKVTADEMLEILADAIGVEVTHLYAPAWSIGFGMKLFPLVKWMIKLHTLPGERPKLEEGILEYGQYGAVRGKIFDNSKLKATGFKFKHPDWKRYIYDVIEWYRERNLLYAEVRR